MRATKTMYIQAKPERVMSFLLDPTAIPAGMTMRAVHETPDVAGNLYEWTFRVLGIRGKGVTLYTEYIPGERLSFRNFGSMEGTSTWDIEPEDGGSNVTIQAESRLAIPVIGRFLEPMLRKQWEKNLAWGKRWIENQAKEKTTA